MRLAFLVALAPALATAQPAAPRPGPADLVPFGPVPGLAGYAVTAKPSKLHCDGIKIVVTRPKRPPAGAQAALAAVFELRYPEGLDFSTAQTPKAKAAAQRSRARFEKLVAELKRTGDAVAKAYAHTGDDEPAFEDAARLVLAHVHATRLLRHAELPADVRTGEFAEEKTMAFCDKLDEVSEPLEQSVRAAYDTCHAGAAQFPGAWWAPVCAK